MWEERNGLDRYTVILLVDLTVSITYDCQIFSLGQRCFVVALCTSNYLVRILFHMTNYVNITISQKYSGNGCTSASSQYQAISLLAARPGYEAKL